MEGILIYDQREKGKSHTILAKEGFVINNPEISRDHIKTQERRYSSN